MLNKYRDVAFAVAQFVLSLLFFSLHLNLGADQMLAGGDHYNVHGPTLHFAFEALRTNSFPLWNPNIFLGFPQYADPHLSTFYPLIWLVARMPVGNAISWLYALHFGFAGAGMYCLMRRFRVSVGGAFFAGAIVSYSAFMVSHLFAGHLSYVMSVSYAPWVIWAMYWAIEKQTFVATIIAALPLGLAILAGHVAFIFHLTLLVSVLMIAAAIAAWRAGAHSATRRILGQWVVLGGMSGLLAAVQLLPTAEFAMRSSRIASADYAFASLQPLQSWGLLGFVAPDLFGAPNANIGYWGYAPRFAYWENALYVGLLPLALYLLAWVYNSKPAIRLWLWISVAGVVIALGADFAIHWILFKLLPGFGIFRIPGRFAWYSAFAIAMVSGWMIDRWFVVDKQPIRTMVRKHALPIILTISVTILFGVFLQASAVDSDARARIVDVINQLFRSTILGIVVLCFLCWQPSSKTYYISVALLIVLIDLWGWGNKLLIVGPTHGTGQLAAAAQQLPTARGEFRISSEIGANGGIPYGLQFVNGYGPLIAENGSQLRNLQADQRILRLLNVRYLIHNSILQHEHATPDTGWTQFALIDNAIIFERQDAQPRAFIVHQVTWVDSAEMSLAFMTDPNRDFTLEAVVQSVPSDNACGSNHVQQALNSTATIHTYEDQLVGVTTQADQDGLLVLSDLYYPGWVAEINGESAEILQTNHALRGVCIPAGQHDVTIRFQPPLFRYGRSMSMVAVVIWMSAFIVDRRYRASLRSPV